jgi:predicted amidohydrolase
MNSLIGQTERNLTVMAEWCDRAAREKADLVVFPELVVHGHNTPNTWELAELVPDGPSVQRIAGLAQRYGMVISFGLAEKERDIVYNESSIPRVTKCSSTRADGRSPCSTSASAKSGW